MMKVVRCTPQNVYPYAHSTRLASVREATGSPARAPGGAGGRLGELALDGAAGELVVEREDMDEPRAPLALDAPQARDFGPLCSGEAPEACQRASCWS